MFALAIDLGTTTLAVSLVDTATGQRLASGGSMNPQRSFGADVVSRLDAAVHSDDALREMSSLIRAELLRLGQEACSAASIPWADVTQVAIAGNPAMQHLLLGLPVKTLAFPPYRPLFTSGKTIAASDLGWPGEARVYVFPMPGGFVGGDTVAFLYGKQGLGTRDQGTVKSGSREQGAGNSKGVCQSPVPSPQSLFLDMGTNGEMALLTGDTIWATSAAAGPAFEGGNLSCGMVALAGAISSVRIDDERVRLKVLGGGAPVGICGSAAIEAVCQLLACNVIEPDGRLRDSSEIPSNLATRIVVHEGANAFVLYRDALRLLLLTQNDIRQIQLAKSAIRAGMEVLAERSATALASIQSVILTGSFGAVLQPEWLKTVGIFDGDVLNTILFYPEGALVGAERALCSHDGFAAVETLAERMRVVPLSGTPLFESKFLQHINFPAR